MVVKPKARTLKYYYLRDIVKYVSEKYKIEKGYHLIDWLCCKLEPREDCTYERLERYWLTKENWGIKPEGENKKMLEALFKEFAPKEDTIQVWMDWQ